MSDIRPVKIDHPVKRTIARLFESYDRRAIKNLFSKLEEIEIAEFNDLKLPNYWLETHLAVLNHTTCNQLTDYKKFVYRIFYAAQDSRQGPLKNACGIPGDYSFRARKHEDHPKESYKERTFKWSECKDAYVNFLTIVFCAYKQDKTKEESDLVLDKIKAIFTIHQRKK
jgi:hypothetical protein